MLKIRRPLGRLIFNMGIAIPGKTVFLIETAPRTCNYSKKSIQYFLLRLGTASNNYYRGNVDRSFSIEAIHMYENTLAWKFHDMVRELHHSILDSPRRGLVMQSFDFFFPFVVRLNNLLKKKSSCRWCKAPRYSCDVTDVLFAELDWLSCGNCEARTLRFRTLVFTVSTASRRSLSSSDSRASS